MNRHQVLTGACNAGDQCYAVGSVEGIHFTAYAAGCDIVILASDFQRVQIIPGVAHGNVKVSCVDCSTDTGKIAASYQHRVYIFEPTPLLHHESSHKLDYRWYQTAVFEADCFINCLSWNLEGFRLLTGGEVIQIWTYTQEHHEDLGGGKSVRFQVGEEDGERKLSDQGQGHPHQYQEHSHHLQDVETVWDCIWRCKPATAVYHLKYSPDGLLFASAGKADRLVKIWYEDRKIQLPLTRIDSVASPKKEELHYSFVYIAHPRAVTGFSWRKTSKYMPRGSVANMLITSCVDNVCRLWCETILPDDGLVDLEQFDPNASVEPKFHTHRHKKRFIQRLKTIRHAIHKRKKHHKFGPETVMSVPHLNSMASVHDFHKSSLHNNGVAPALHFHLAASINPETDIPLLPVVGAKGENQFNFQLHWLNNKELEFTMEAEIILQELHHGTLGTEEGQEGHPYDNHHDGSDSDHHQEQAETDGTHYKKKKTKRFKRLHKHSRSNAHRRDSETSNGSDRSDHTSDGISSTPDVPGSVIDALDRKIEVLLRDWHQNPDMMFSIHPVDGSFLVWLVDWLDEYNPYCFRQAQVSFSSRLPHAFPVPDARTMASNLLMYCNYSKMDIKSAMKITETNSPETTKVQNQPAPATGKSSPGQNDNMLIPNVLLISKHLNGSLNQWQISFTDNSKFSTVVSVAHASRACGHRFRTNNATCHPVLPLLLTTSHHNIPNDSSKSSPSDIDQGIQMTSSHRSEGSNQSDGEAPVGGVEFCSELILWRVDPVGPLSKSGGIVELARINSPQVSAFSNVAWVPTLLPSSTLGSYSNSPSALFVASDGNSLRLYQAVIDARTLLQEIGPQKKDPTVSFCSNTSSGYSVDVTKPPSELFNIVSVQSSARPGCIIELETIAEASQTWHQIQLLHVFQEQLITGHPSCSPSDMEAIVDLRNSGSFSQNFYLVVLEKLRDHGSVLHMWKITISSQSTLPEEDLTHNYVPDIQLIQDDGSNPASRSGTPDPAPQRPTAVVKLLFSSSKVYSERLPLPDGVDISTATVAAGHLSSASIYPACLAPYSLVTACSDGDLRFWKCDVLSVHAAPGSCMDHSISTTSFEVGVEEEDGIRRPLTSVFTKCEVVDTTYKWEEWSMINKGQNTSAINVPGQPITISCAYSGRLAVAYRLFGVRVMPDNPHGKLVNLWVAIYECESTGGAEWVLEDTIELKNVSIPDPKAEIDLNCIFSPQNEGLSPRNQSDDGESPAKGLSPSASLVNINRTKSVPSLSTICSVRKCISDFGNKAGLLKQKHLVQLDWVSTEDGSHILTVGVGSKVLMYAQVSNDVVYASKRTVSESGDHDYSSASIHSNKNRGNLSLHLGEGVMNKARTTSHRRVRMQKSKSMVIDDTPEEVQWMKLRSIELTTADGLPPLPMHISWVRAGILVVGMDNEMHVYSQWRNSVTNTDSDEDSDADDNRKFDDASLQVPPRNLTRLTTMKTLSSLKPSYSMPSLKHLQPTGKRGSDGNLGTSKLNGSSESLTSLTAIHDFGLFEASRQANPVLPQYHPKKLMELLNFGKIRRVKAILAHLVRCIAGGEIHPAYFTEEAERDDSKWGLSRPRTVSVSGASPNDVLLQDEPEPDYKEISSIPPLPMYALLAADEDTTVAKNDHISSAGQQNAAVTNDYSDLFSSNVIQDDDLDVNVLGTSADSNRSARQRVLSSTGGQANVNPNYFGPGHSQMMTKHLTHTQLPGLSSLDQMYLLAIADTVASIKMDFADRFDSEKSGLSSTESQGTVQANETIDDCGLRFLLAMQHHIYLFRTLQPRQRAILSRQGLRSFNLVWAFHSEATEELLSHIPSMQKGEPQWEELRQFGVGWWINNINILKRTFEKVAKAAFQKKKDPMDAALFYLAMKKKNVLWGLYRSVENKRMTDFFKHDFTQERWRRAALKNAFDLLGKQRFEHAAAFFLLAGSLDDAIEVCMDKLGDMQLALAICRLYSDTDMMPDSVKKILYTQILGRDEDGKNYNSDFCSPDPFLRSMALWLFKDYRGSLKTLLHTSEKRRRKVEDHNELEGHNTLPSVFNFYNYLRTHPLLIRERISKAAPNKRNTSVIPGFTRQQTIVSDSAVFVDKVTPMERRLFFKTAHTHFRNGCPLLALEVLSKLPPMTDHEEEDSGEEGGPLDEKCILSGKLEGNSSQGKHDVTDWSQPITNGVRDTNSCKAFDWSTPISSQGKDRSDAFDWSTPSRNLLDEEEPKFNLSSSESENSEDEQSNVEVNDQRKVPKLQKIPTIVLSDEEDDDRKVLFDAESKMPKEKSVSEGGVDIFAQQYKFIACLKVLMEEMRTLATGFEVDGGQLRFQLYIWLEKEVEVLQYLCHYSEELYPDNQDAPPPRSENFIEDLEMNGTFDEVDEEGGNVLDVTPRVNRSLSVRSDSSMISYKPTLHEVILAEKMDFEAKLERMAKRKQWLRTHHQLVRTLASYCMLNGYGGGGLASVQMELLLLLQELQQEKPQQQLLTPLPFPTTLPLLSASIASSKTVVADPIQHIQCMAQDVLHSVIELTTPPSIATPFNSVVVMRDLSIALSSCVYQCLCDCDSFVVSLNENTDASLEGFTGYNFTKTQAGYLMAGVQKHRRKSNAGDEVVNTSPIKWPGVTSLRVLLAREKDEDAPKLSILMCETLVAVYISLLVNALTMYDCHMLYRLVAHRFDQQMWSALFGGGVKTVLKVANATTPPRSGDDMSKQRMRFNMKAMGQGPSSNKEKKTYKETFVPPELSMVTFFMTKPFPSSDSHFSYDSEESLSSEDEDDDSEEEATRPNTLPLSAVQQHIDPTSYSWSLIRYTVVKLVLHNLHTFLPIVGIELQELPVCSPLIHAVMKTLEQWSEILHSKLDLFAGPPEEFISSLQFDVTNGAPNTKVHALLNHSNSPFIDSHSTLPIKRLWFHLIRQEPVKEIFLRHIFRRQKEPMQDSTDSSYTTSEGSTTYKEPMKIIHKEQDLITAFALNQGSMIEANANCLALSTQKEVVEVDISPILRPPTWLEDENELDIEFIKNPNPPGNPDSVDFYVVQTPLDGIQQQSNYTSGVSSPQTGANTPIHSPMSQTGRGTNIGKGIHIPGITNPQVSHRIYDRSKRLLRMILRRPVPGVRRIGSHPSLPHYLTGSADGSVRLYEWGHMQPLAMLRQPGAFPKVTKVLFSVHGNKCCVSDTEGDICLWQVGIGTNFNKPIMSLKCHNKTTSDFAFVGSSSLIATAGHSSESKNVCLWDTLLPQRSACVHAFTCHEHGCPAVVYAPHHQLLISGGRKGEVCIFDIRQRQLRHTFQAHDVPIRCLAMDPEEEYFVTGSSEGDIKVWGLDVHQLVVNFPGEHSKNTFFRNMGSASGVTQVAIGTGHHLFSCGVDGSMKFRSLPERESMVRYWTA